ncbi:diguanylate cyclase [Pseudoalteromonas sp. S1727]|uniref:DEAD/DEAH box helicase n=1 Tax=Pseudoalteromonas sp. S1727 TaxID=2066514 RepID=UPI001109A815|nr:DEAD/DEAH box helicase family protein [Pseudoalteromonas sp. S1727]TMN71290.1 diguanylate cyclase [Pseudoalteromonas sp. S1727]
MLRSWQRECVELAVKKYTAIDKHFLCQATPGAGKTIMAASLAKALFDKGMIDRVICFSPSVEVANNIKRTFGKIIGCSFDGSFTAVGASMTYQSLCSIPESTWDGLRKYRTFFIFDEIHHCSFSQDKSKINTWGEKVVFHLQDIATYTLALSGTPWRSDAVPIALVNYSDPEGELICDYQYSLSQAIRDNVCREPKIVLVDSNSISDGHDTYGSIAEFVKKAQSAYQEVLNNDSALRYLLKLAVLKLSVIRVSNPTAGGLVVASSVKHAEMINSLLIEEFNQTSTIVTYLHDNSTQKINTFKSSTEQWIVSVGMISEGTDIPRLQVCCHLSSIKTELYFRQVLGRILRSGKGKIELAWLFTFAETSLIEFAERINIDIPDSCSYVDMECDTILVREDIFRPLTSPKINRDNKLKEILDKLVLGGLTSERGIAYDELLSGCSLSSIQIKSLRTRVIEAFL